MTATPPRRHRPAFPFSDAVPGRKARRLNAAGHAALAAHLAAHPEPTAFVRAKYPALAAWAFATPDAEDECRAACLAALAASFARYDAAHPSGASPESWACKLSRHAVRTCARRARRFRVPQSGTGDPDGDGDARRERADPADGGRAASEAAMTVRRLAGSGRHLPPADWDALLAHYAGTLPMAPAALASLLAILRAALVPQPE